MHLDDHTILSNQVPLTAMTAFSLKLPFLPGVNWLINCFFPIPNYSSVFTYKGLTVWATSSRLIALYPAAIIKSINTALFSGSQSPFSGLTLVGEFFWGDFLAFLEGVLLRSGLWSSDEGVIEASEDDRFISVISDVKLKPI